MAANEFVVATSVDGPLEIHRAGCDHLPKLYRSGGGNLSAWPTLAEAKRAAAADEVPWKLAPCCRTATK